MTLIEYLERNQQPNRATGKWHDKLVSYVISNKERIGIPEDAILYQEVRLVPESRREVACPDMIFVAGEELFVVEAKTYTHNRRGNESRLRMDLGWQLQRSYTFFKTHFGVEAVLIGVYRSGRKGFKHFVRDRPGHISELEEQLKKGEVE